MGNWKIRIAAGTIFKRGWFKTVGFPNLGGRVVRYWDRAATEAETASPDPDWTVGTRVRRAENGFYYVEDVERFRARPATVKLRIRNIAEQDGYGVQVLLARDPASAGKAEVSHLIQYLEGFDVRAIPERKKKELRALLAGGASAQSEAGNVMIVKAPWNRAFLEELEAFGSRKGHDDQADSFVGAMNALMLKGNEPDAGWL